MSLPDRLMKVSIPYLIAAAMTLFSVSFAAGTYKQAFENEKTRVDTMQMKLDALTTAVNDLTIQVKVLSQHLEDQQQ